VLGEANPGKLNTPLAVRRASGLAYLMSLKGSKVQERPQGTTRRCWSNTNDVFETTWQVGFRPLKAD
jgi:hypothetical protein